MFMSSVYWMWSRAGNGQVPNPSYEQVCTGRTGHNEVVKLVFDPAQISVREILEIFLAILIPPPSMLRATTMAAST